MFSELIQLGKTFYNLHKRWLSYFLIADCFFLVAGFLNYQFVLSEQMNSDFRHLFLAWFFLFVPLVMQVFLGVHLGLSFSLKAPQAWFTRLPFSKLTSGLFPNLVIGLNALVLYLPFFRVWGHSYEITGYPLAFSLILVPSIAFQISRSIRRLVVSIALSVLTGLFIFSITAILVTWFYPVGIFKIPRFSPLQVNLFLLNLCFLIILAVDFNRRALLKLVSIIAFGLFLFLGTVAYIDARHRQSEYYLQLKSFESQLTASKPQCEVFTKRVAKLIKSADERKGDEHQFTDKKQLLDAVEVLKDYPQISYYRREVIMAWSKLANQPSLRASFPVLFNTYRCSPLSLFELIKHIVPAVHRITSLSTSERLMVAKEVWQSLSTFTRESTSLLEAMTSIAAIRIMDDHQLLKDFPQDKLNTIRSKLAEINKKALESTEDYRRLRTPSNGNLRGLARSIYEFEVKPTAAMVEQLIEIVAQAKLANIS